MCLAVPMQITHIDGFNASCSAKGVQREVNLFLLQDDDIQVGDYVLIHVGYAIQKISEQDAQTAWELFDQMFSQEEAEAAMIGE